MFFCFGIWVFYFWVVFWMFICFCWICRNCFGIYFWLVGMWLCRGVGNCICFLCFLMFLGLYLCGSLVVFIWILILLFLRIWGIWLMCWVFSFVMFLMVFFWFLSVGMSLWCCVCGILWIIIMVGFGVIRVCSCLFGFLRSGVLFVVWLRVMFVVVLLFCFLRFFILFCGRIGRSILRILILRSCYSCLMLFMLFMCGIRRVRVCGLRLCLGYCLFSFMFVIVLWYIRLWRCICERFVRLFFWFVFDGGGIWLFFLGR